MRGSIPTSRPIASPVLSLLIPGVLFLIPGVFPGMVELQGQQEQGEQQEQNGLQEHVQRHERQDSGVPPALRPSDRIRVRGPSVEHLGRPTLGHTLRSGLGAWIGPGRVRPGGVVVRLDADTLVFTDLNRGRLVAVSWEELERVEVHRGRDPLRGALEGGLFGAVAGAVWWGVMDALWDDSVFDTGGFRMAVPVGAALGALTGAVAWGDVWERVRPAPDGG